MNVKHFNTRSISVKRAVLGFSGWPDAGRIVEHTLGEFKRGIPHEPLADWDMDGFWHAESTRPRITVHHGRIRDLKWPVYHFWIMNPESSPPILLGAGPEPTIFWRPFVDQLVELLRGWECEELYLLGGLYDHITHEETVVSGVGQDIKAYNQLHALQCHRTEYQGPGAIHSSIMTAAHESGIHCLAFWAHYPFYLSGRHESLMARLLGILGQLLNLTIETRHLTARWERRTKDIEETIQKNDDLMEMLESIKKGQVRRPFFGESSKVVRLDEFVKRREESPFNKDP